MRVDPAIADSARKHGVPDAHMLHALRNTVHVFEPDDEGLTMLIGPRPDGDLLEVGVVDAEPRPVIVHAMRARPKYLPGGG